MFLHKVKPLNIMLSRTSAYVKRYDWQTKCLCMTEDDDLLQKYNITCNEFSTDMKKRFDSVSVYNKNYLKTKMKSHADELTDF